VKEKFLLSIKKFSFGDRQYRAKLLLKIVEGVETNPIGE
jgi:hypothetical protein